MRLALHTRLTREPAGVGSTFEFICDHPVAANWRLKADRAAPPWGLRLTCYSSVETDEVRARVDRVNARLREASGSLIS